MNKIFICPAWEKISDEQFEVLFSKTSRTRADLDESLFYHIHTPVIVKDENGKEWKEHQILDLFDLNNPRKVVTIIQGNTGTGKSELCLYLYFELKKRGRKIILIEKNATLIDVLSKTIPEFYEELTGKEFPKKERADQLKQILINAPKNVAKMASSAVVLTLVEARSIPETDLTVFGELLEDLVLKNLKILTQKGEDPTDMEFVKPEQLKSNQFSEISKFIEGESIYDQAVEINKLLWESIRKHYQVPTLDNALEILSKETGNLRPIIIFEDFSIAGLDFEKLIKYMEVDNPTHICDFIIAGVQEKVPRRVGTRVERFKYFSTTTPEQPQVLFLNEDTCLNFIEKYLDYPKTNNQTCFTSSNKVGICDTCGKCTIENRPFFPFNNIFIKRIFETLKREDKKPRTYVDTIKHVLREYRKNRIIPSDTDTIRSLNPTQMVDYEEIKDSKLQNFANWYGQINNDRTEVDIELAELLGIINEEFKRGTMLSFPLFKAAATFQNVLESLKEGPTENREDYASIFNQWYIWKDNPSSEKVTEFRNYFNDGLKFLLEKVTGGFCLRTGSSICLKIGQNEYPFHIPGITKLIDQSIEIYPGMFTQKGSTSITELGIYYKKTNLKTDSKFENVIFKTIENNSYPLGRMIDKLRNNVQNNLEEKCWSQYYSSNYDIHHTILACIKIRMLFDDPLQKISVDEIAKWLIAKDCLQYESDQKLPSWIKAKLDQILLCTEQIKKIAMELFGLTENYVDVEKVKRIDNSLFDPIAAVKGIKKCGGKKNLLLDGTPIHEIIEPFSNIMDIKKCAWDTLQENPEIDDIIEDVQIILDLLNGLEPQNLKSRIKKLQDKEQVDDDFIRELKNLSDLSNESLQIYVSDLQEFLSMANKNGLTDFENLSFTLAIEKLLNDPTFRTLKIIRQNVEKQRISIEEKPIEELFSILGRIRDL